MSEFKSQWIEKLASADPRIRAQAASEIYRAGRQRAELAVRSWWEHAEFAQLCGQSPAVTVGLAVQQLTFANIREANESPRLAKVPPEQDASEFELHFAGGISLDILTTRDAVGDGAIARFLAKFGEGVQQVEFRCDDVDRAAVILRENFAVQPLYPAKRPGADGTHVNFFLVPAPDQTKVLIELYESTPSSAKQS